MRTKQRYERSRSHQLGVTLVELAVALVVIALLLGSLIVPLQTQIQNRKIDDTKRILDQAREALLGFVATYGYFPCPATSTSNGQEQAGTDHVTGNCPVSYYGFLPAAALGLAPVDANGFAIDAWALQANRIRYAVSNQSAGVANPFTTGGGMKSAGLAALGLANFFYVCASGTGVVAGTNCGTAVTLTSTAPVVIWSSGANASTSTGGASVDEAENPNANGGSADRIFVSRPIASASGSEFDDIVTWIGLPTIVSRMIAVGQLP